MHTPGQSRMQGALYCLRRAVHVLLFLEKANEDYPGAWPDNGASKGLQNCETVIVTFLDFSRSSPPLSSPLSPGPSAPPPSARDSPDVEIWTTGKMSLQKGGKPSHPSGSIPRPILGLNATPTPQEVPDGRD